MKAIVQRVTSAKVTVGEELISSIGRGICVLVGITHSDTENDVDYLCVKENLAKLHFMGRSSKQNKKCRKLLSLRLFEDQTGKRWQKSVHDENLEILCVSQFTLYSRLKGNKPDFHLAMQGQQAQQLYQTFLHKLGQAYDVTKIKDGKFGAYMQVHIQNDGPVTIELESPVEEPKNKSKTSGVISNEIVDK